jgi:hypothetical protein
MKTIDSIREIDPRDDLRQVSRYPLAVQRDCQLCVITFKDLAWRDHTAYIKDFSIGGVGVESEKRIGQGFVWFKDRVGGHRGGVLMWSRQVGYNYRAGIQFVPLSRDAERFVQDQVGLLRAHQPMRNPEAIIATIMNSMGKERK